VQFKATIKSFSYSVRVKSLRTYSICNLHETGTHKIGLHTYDGNFAPRLIKLSESGNVMSEKVASVKL